MIRRLIAITLASATFAACQQAPSPPNRPTPTSTPTSAPTGTATVSDQEELDRLRALGYLDYSEEAPQAEGEGTLLLDQRRVFLGSTLVIYGGSCAAELITLDGRIINSWSQAECRRWDQALLGEDGSLLVVGSRSDTDRPASEQMESSFLIKLTWGNQVLWQRSISAHHDIEVLPSGEMLTLLIDRRTVASIDPDAELWDNPIGHLDGDGRLIESISLLDIVNRPASGFDLHIAGRGSALGEKWIDILHCNEIEVVGRPPNAQSHRIYSDDNLLITSRTQDAIFVVNWRTRELLWSWGPGELSGPHGAVVLDNGHLLIFDNGLSRRWSRVVQLDPVSGRIVNEYGPPDRSQFFSRVMGANQGLPNGNVLITNSAGGQGLEFTPDGQPAWIFMGTHRTAGGHRVKIPRMTRYSIDETEAILARVR